MSKIKPRYRVQVELSPNYMHRVLDMLAWPRKPDAWDRKAVAHVTSQWAEATKKKKGASK